MHIGANIKLFGNPFMEEKFLVVKHPPTRHKNPPDVLYGLCEVETRGFASTLAVLVV